MTTTNTTAEANPGAPGSQPHPHDDESVKSPMRWVKRGVVGAVVLVALVYGAIFFYAKVINDAPDALGEEDLSAALAEPTPADAEPAPADAAVVADVAAPADTAGVAPADTAAAAGAVAGFDGIWMPTIASEFGYRVEEVLGGVNTTAVGRSNEIDGSLTVDGSTAIVDVSVQIANITSDDSRRDNQFTGRIMDATNFPTATFRTTEAIDFGDIPASGQQVTAVATGELTLKGVTQTVVVEVTAQSDGDSIGVLGSIPVLFEDYGIANPSNAGVKTEDSGLVEFVLVFARS